MGLDNYIYISGIDKNKYPKKFMKPEFWYDDKFEACYWRKNKYIRNNIITRCNLDYDGEGGTIEISSDDIETIIEIIEDYCDNIYWQRRNGSDELIEYDLETNQRYIDLLNWIEHYITYEDLAGEAIIEFVDSY